MPTRSRAISLSFAASAAIWRHCACFGLETGQSKRAVVNRTKGFGGATVDGTRTSVCRPPIQCHPLQGDDERRLVRHVIEIDDDLLDQQPHQPLLGASVGVDGVPDGRQVVGETEQRISIDSRPGGDLFRHLAREWATDATAEVDTLWADLDNHFPKEVLYPNPLAAEVDQRRFLVEPIAGERVQAIALSGDEFDALLGGPDKGILIGNLQR